MRLHGQLLLRCRKNKQQRKNNLKNVHPKDGNTNNNNNR